MKRFLLLFILICLLAAVFIVVKGSSSGNADRTQYETEQMDSGLVCVFYANTFLSIDKNGTVCENNSVKPDDQPLIEGVDFTKLAFGKKAQTSDETALEYILKVAACLDKHQIRADRISYSNRMAVIHIGNLDIQLGKNEKTDDKINDLNNFIDMILGSSGTLYMQNANANNYGYTFRAR